MVLRTICITTTFLLALLTGCKKQEPIPYPLSELPPATQTGARTFGCVINGKPWVAGVHVFAPQIHTITARYDEPDYGLDYGRRFVLTSQYLRPTYNWMNDSLSSSFNFILRPIIGKGDYNLSNLETKTISFQVSFPKPSRTYVIDTLSVFDLRITMLDTINKIVSGTFEFDMRNTSDTTETLQIRHGRFDARYNPE